MKKNTTLSNLVMLAIALLPAGYLALTWNSIPSIVSIHYNINMEPDKYGDKSALWPLAFIIAGTSLLTYFLINNIYRIDPKRRFKPQSPVFNKIATGILIFMTTINFIMIVSASKGHDMMGGLIFPLLGLLLAFIGNNMNNIKPNYFAGFRLPWTLSDDNNWRKTHHLASKIWFWGGLFLAIISLFLPFKLIIPVFISIVLIMSIIPAIYSYRIFKNKALNG